jgi:excinuclease ABC subunit A
VFEGILPNLERRYRETESSTVREELAKYQRHARLPGLQGTRLNRTARHVFVGGPQLPDASRLSVAKRAAALLPAARTRRLARRSRARIVKEVGDRLRFLVDVGLDYLTLDRSAETLSGGEAQRIRLASQIGSGLTGVMYILDEPSIGLHQRDNARLLGTLKRLRDLGNSVLVVEHDEDAIMSADHVIDLGPGAGVHGGARGRQGTPKQILADARLADRPVPLRPQADRSVPRLRSPSAIRRCKIDHSRAPPATTCRTASRSISRSAC